MNVHAIDEAESLTSSILVMSRGKLKFLGSEQQ
jgi:ABC-type multidrug transport system ATPase subunit